MGYEALQAVGIFIIAMLAWKAFESKQEQPLSDSTDRESSSSIFRLLDTFADETTDELAVNCVAELLFGA